MIDASPRRVVPPARPRRPSSVAAVAVMVACVLLLVWGINRIVGGGGHFTPGCTVATSAGRFTLNPTQAANASTIAAVGKHLGMPDHAVTVALAASLQESGLVNLAHGDRDSVGLFQQRPSEGWGPPFELRHPVYAATAFYRALTRVPGWETLTVTKAAQDVQHSAAPDAYANEEPEARSLAIALTGEVPAAFACHLRSEASSMSSAWRAALADQLGKVSPESPVSSSDGWALASWLVAHAKQYGFTSVSFAGRSWTPATGLWLSGGVGGEAVHVR